MAFVVLPLAFVSAGGAMAQSSGNSSQANAELFYMIQQLQGEVRRLQGEVEEQKNQIDRLSKQSRDRYIDLDQRILKVSSELADRPASAQPNLEGEDPAANSGQPKQTTSYRQPSAEERKAYEAIQKLIREDKNYDAAINGLYDFIDQYDEGDLTVNAYYWLGEVYLVQDKLEQAKQAFTIVSTRFGDHRKAPDASYKLGVALGRQGNQAEAEARMNTVIRNYPNSNAASLARKFLSDQNS